ncbi:MAG: DUF4340 domain-containing protein [Pirellulaceae bacterium]
MNENIKTLIFAGIGIVLAGLAYATLPAPSENVLPKLTGQPLFGKFTDSTKAAGLEILRYDKDKHKVESLKVEKSGGIWKLPSHGSYPADAQDQLKDAAGSLLGVKALGLATEFPEEHHLFGVLDPSQKIDDSKKEDVGMLVVVRDEKGEELARMIIGKAVKDPPGQRFVRVAKDTTTFTDDVYVAKIDIEKLPTEFNKWIEQDLLRINPNDVKRLTLKDYSVLEQQGGYAAEKRMEAAISWDTLSAVWNLDRFQLFTRGLPHEAALGDGEELNKQKLDEMKTALDELKIEDVVRKPPGAETDTKVRQTQIKMGFIPAQDKKLYSTNGEVYVDLLDGVRYILRFGDIAGVQAGSDGKKLNRYLLVNAELTDDVLNPPMLEPEPAGPAAPPATPPTTPPAAETPKPNGGACQEEPKAEGKDEPKAAEPAKEKAKAEPGKTKAKAGAEPPTKPVKPIAKPDPAQLELDRIKKANQRKLDEYTLKKKKADAKVADLNSRFRDWYYVISEDTYKKIHLGRTDIIREGASAKETGFGIDAFRLLEKNGINPPPPPPPMGGRGPGGPGGGFPGGLPPGFPPM